MREHLPVNTFCIFVKTNIQRIFSGRYVMEVGCMVLEDSAGRLLVNPEVLHAYLGGRK